MSLIAVARTQPSVRWAAGSWAFFIVENAVLSENRTWLIEQLGDERYHAVYGTFSTVATASIGYAYYRIRKDASANTALQLWAKTAKPPTVSAVGGFVFLSVGLAMATQTLPKFQLPFAVVDSNDAPSSSSSWQVQVRCPFDFTDKTTASDDGAVRGLERITRHPGLWSFGLIGLSQAMLSSNLALRAWWMGPAAIAWLGGAHTDSRFRRGMGGTLDPNYDSQTSNVPFAAILTGRQGSDALSRLMDESKPLNVAVAVLASALWVAKRAR